jgi:hypothetical protein
MGIRAADYQHDVDGKQGLRTRSLQRCDFSPYEAFFSMGYIYALKRAPDVAILARRGADRGG